MGSEKKAKQISKRKSVKDNDKDFHAELKKVLKGLKRPTTREEKLKNWHAIGKVTKGTVWMSPDFDDPLELV